MYPEYFGLKEPSFSITPDPHYLYLSQEHREALAHLLYGALESGGFVLLTGEVGTGKTTICRAFLEQLLDQVDLALVLNPALTAPELLHTICDEFGVKLPGEAVSTKVLVDCLNGFLLQAHAGGRRPVLMIDEAQNLRPEVLEQIRLLTNLETHKHKLLQIFLVGQPELRTLLQQRGLRQLDQRITARYHLLPLSAGETSDYIAHRLAVAGVQRRLFTKSAVRRIYRLSNGVPRLINILCDRALLGAFATHRQVIDSGIVAKAARELRGERRQSEGRRYSRRLPWLASAMLLLAVAGGLSHLWKDRWPVASITGMVIPDTDSSAPAAVASEPVTPPTPTKVEPAPAATPAVAAETDSDRIETATPPMEHRPDLSMTVAAPPAAPRPAPTDLAALARVALDQRAAMTHLLAAWGVDYPATETMEPCGFVQALGLRCRQTTGDWQRLQSYDRPGVIRLRDEAGEQRYLPVLGLDPPHALVASADGPLQVPLESLQGHWSGSFLILWRPPPGGDMLIGRASSGAGVSWLRQLIGRVHPGQAGDPESQVFDDQLFNQVRRFQGDHGLTADGIAGPETLIRLSNAAQIPNTPRLRKRD